MRDDVKRRVRREQNALSVGYEHRDFSEAPDIVVGDALTHKPQLDNAFNTISLMTDKILRRMHTVLDNLDTDVIPDRRTLRDFKDLCETVQKQAKTYIEIEKHMKSQEAGVDREMARKSIQTTLLENGFTDDVVKLVWKALGISPTTSTSKSPTSAFV